MRRSLVFLGAMGCGYFLLWLMLPPRSEAAEAAWPTTRGGLRRRICEDVEVAAGRWRRIVVHHSATLGGNAERFHRFHLHQRGWKGGLGYHFVIGNGRGSGDGQIEIGPRWRKQADGVHVRGHNAGSIGICLVGDLDTAPPTRAQVRALVRLVRCLMEVCGLEAEDVMLHRDLVPTACPGRFFPAEEFRADLSDLSGEGDPAR